MVTDIVQGIIVDGVLAFFGETFLMDAEFDRI